MTGEDLEMRTLVRESDVIDRTDGSELAKAFNYLWEKYVEQEPKTGHWIECMPRGVEEWCYKCSKCNFWKYEKTINLSKFNYCPNCGAKMVEPQESEEV